MNSITVLRKLPGRNAEWWTIPNTLQALKEIVGGKIEIVTIHRDLVVVCNAEMIGNGSRYNCKIKGTMFFGPIVLAGAQGDALASLPRIGPDYVYYFPELWPHLPPRDKKNPLPCRIGDTAWGIRNYKGDPIIRSGRVREMYYSEDMELIIVVERVCRGRWMEQVFPSEEAARKAVGGGRDG